MDNTKNIVIKLHNTDFVLSEEQAKELIEDLTIKIYGISYKSMQYGRRVLFDIVEQIKDIIKDWDS